MNKYRELPSVEYLHECFTYDRATGLLTWNLERPDYHFKNKQAISAWKTKYGGNIMNTTNPIGYVTIAMMGTKYLAHRIIWKMVTGDDPINFEIDHSDNNKSNNRFENLRLATRNENQHNRPKVSTNKSGYKGVSWDNTHMKWRACININKKYIGLGYYVDKMDAVLAYNNAANIIHKDFKNYEDIDHELTLSVKDDLKSNNSSGYKGVYASGAKFRAYYAHNKTRYDLGLFNTAEEASLAYVNKKIEISQLFPKELTLSEKYQCIIPKANAMQGCSKWEMRNLV